MKISKQLPAIFVVAILVLGVGIIGWRFFGSSETSVEVSVKVPPLSAPAQKGKLAYDSNCVACHGADGAGSEQGSPLVNDIYNPGHHADEAFIRATRLGVRQHHWRFGNMEPQPQISLEETVAIIKYIRELQRANGIFYKPHRM